ncbi:hypothetical protein [Vibrio fluvialis]|uniref:hypothetical protein n=2 Tax=Vibrio fluvialis TaxID=676 RepID=UPI00192AA27B|nr:hypothetical protein [Vibrio fluvialis]MBL4240810.1 hypothetical protein [Vibrio fluvialis]MBL4266283.1 hypothetical protein [Vibrio fluvialis]MBL4268849.1 hypothetical protein [Vibrio fluvialis]MBL4275151.1 hypothetical protein [Vibrio fluvialis]MBO1439264.1 hypothetical protein [Vibrio fluvialis]
MMLNTSVTTFYFSWEEQQKTAIYILLLGAVKSWRRFEKILSRMNTTGEKQKGDKARFNNLARINAILEGEQQRSFNTWVYLLDQENENDESNFAKMRPYTPRTGYAWRTKREMVEQQISQLNNNNGYYV